MLDILKRIAEDPSRNTAAIAAGISIIVLLVVLVVLLLIAFALPAKARAVPAKPKRRLPRWAIVLITGPLAVIGLSAAVALWYQGTSTNEYCTRTCHAMALPAESWSSSLHSDIDCVRCHEGPKWKTLPQALVSRSHSLFLELTGTPAQGDHVSPDVCMSCHANVIEKPLVARNGEQFLHGEALTIDPGCTRCHGAQGHEPAWP